MQVVRLLVRAKVEIEEEKQVCASLACETAHVRSNDVSSLADG